LYSASWNRRDRIRNRCASTRAARATKDDVRRPIENGIVRQAGDLLLPKQNPGFPKYGNLTAGRGEAGHRCRSSLEKCWTLLQETGKETGNETGNAS
jgi:hypothetical protein